jgi:hypothetical protein
MLVLTLNKLRIFRAFTLNNKSVVACTATFKWETAKLTWYFKSFQEVIFGFVGLFHVAIYLGVTVLRHVVLSIAMED